MKLVCPITLLALPLFVAANGALRRRGYAPHSGFAHIKRSEATLQAKVALNINDKCTYPAPAATFDVRNFAGPTPDDPIVWYTLASRDEPIMKECTCTTADYGLFPNGSLSAHTTCMLNNTLLEVVGRADPVENFPEGAYKTVYGKSAAGPCPGPNYIVRKVWSSAPGQLLSTGTGAYQVAVITTPSNSWYLLSTTRRVDRSVLDNYIKELAALDISLDEPWSFEEQTNCSDQPARTAKPKDDAEPATPKAVTKDNSQNDSKDASQDTSIAGPEADSDARKAKANTREALLL